MTDFRWTDEKIDELITLDEAFPCLYNVKIKEYSSRDLRRKALTEIAESFKISG